MLEASRRDVVVQVMTEQVPAAGIPIHSLIDHVQRQVQQVRRQYPELTDYYLNDVSLRLQSGVLLAICEFRKGASR